MKISIIGDSFAADTNIGSWPNLLSQTHQIKNYSLRGISQYRIFDIITKNLAEIQKSDAVVIWHTNPDRIYVNDEILFPTRKLYSHPTADLVSSDSLSSGDKNWQTIVKNYYKIFYNAEQQLLYYQLMFEKIKLLLHQNRPIHCSGFNLPLSDIKNFTSLRETNPGKINHFDTTGNLIVFDYISKHL